MERLIRIEEVKTDGNGVQCVNARDLHVFLEIGKEFVNWIKDRIEQCGYEGGKDFIIFANSGKKSGRGRPQMEYQISLDMAKELCMIERNEKGRQARQYFIECERRLKAGTAEYIHIAKVRWMQQRLAKFETLEAIDASKVMDRPKYQKMKKYRSMGLSQIDTAKLLDISKDTVKRYEALERKYQTQYAPCSMPSALPEVSHA